MTIMIVNIMNQNKSTISYSKSITEGLDYILSTYNDSLLLGQDIQDPYGGAFNITKGLSSKYPTKVINTPISEAALTGAITGMSIRGMKPILEIMFGDFMTLCTDQIINHASIFPWLTNGETKVDWVIRTPMGINRGYGPTHSKTIEKLFFGIPGIKVICPSHFHNPKELLINSFLDESPVIFIENKMLYSKPLYKFYRNKEHFHFTAFPSSEIFLALRTNRLEYPYITIAPDKEVCIIIVTYGGMLVTVLDAVTELYDEGIYAKIVCPSWINSFNVHIANLILDEIDNSKNKLLTVEEGTIFGGWGSSLVSYLAEFNSTGDVYMLGAKENPIGDGVEMEQDTIPSKEKIKETIRYMV